MKRLLVILALVLSGCNGAIGSPVASAPSVGDNTNGHWSYIDGPHGEHCLVYSLNVGSYSGVMAMSCDSVRP